jgi:hypothetical protein
LTWRGTRATINAITGGEMQGRPSGAVRFCNNPACERCDQHVRPGEILRKDGHEVCPACHEELVTQEPRPRPAQLRTRADRPAGRPPR